MEGLVSETKLRRHRVGGEVKYENLVSNKSIRVKYLPLKDNKAGVQGPVTRSMVSTNHLFRSIETYSRFSRDVTVAMLAYRTIAKKPRATFCHCFVHQDGRLIT